MNAACAVDGLEYNQRRVAAAKDHFKSLPMAMNDSVSQSSPKGNNFE
jgi:hypothetical protein